MVYRVQVGTAVMSIGSYVLDKIRPSPKSCRTEEMKIISGAFRYDVNEERHGLTAKGVYTEHEVKAWLRIRHIEATDAGAVQLWTEIKEALSEPVSVAISSPGTMTGSIASVEEPAVPLVRPADDSKLLENERKHHETDVERLKVEKKQLTDELNSVREKLRREHALRNLAVANRQRLSKQYERCKNDLRQREKDLLMEQGRNRALERQLENIKKQK